MDNLLLRTFLEVAATGSFINASERLFVTQSAVSLRIQRLEEALGKPLFTRSKAGAELTQAGREFERYALSLIKIWEEARQHVGLPEGYTKSLTIGAHYSLWPRLGFRWLDALQETMPTLNIRAELGMPDRLIRYLTEGQIQVALTYTPQLRSGLSAHKIADETLVLASAVPATMDALGDKYVFVDWGPEFVHAHRLELPELGQSGLSLSLGAMSADYVRRRGKAAYLPARYIKRYLDDGSMHLVPEAPRFPFPIWSVWRDDLEGDIQGRALASLVAIQTQLAELEGEVLQDLRMISPSQKYETLGNAG
ncbi:LysR family transcriptional regulator [Roseovarius sp. C7]|uniref:LysR family transcriptional regulator n=1 Tax=Roseovarius sp. C7 TaxID=3398643 RepID=UPI0039F6C76D